MAKYHKIKKGDTFWGLEKQYGLKHGTLQQLNPHLNPKTLQIGSQIIISEEKKEENKVPKIQSIHKPSTIKEDFESNEQNMLPFNIVHKAKEVISIYQKNKVRYSQSKREFGINAKFSDCSATVHTILKLSNALEYLSSTNTSSMRQEIQSRGGSFRKDNPLEGDIMMWGGHVTIVTSVRGNTLEFAHMGNSGPRIGRVTLTNNRLDTENVWGSGGFIGFWTIK